MQSIFWSGTESQKCSMLWSSHGFLRDIKCGGKSLFVEVERKALGIDMSDVFTFLKYLNNILSLNLIGEIFNLEWVACSLNRPNFKPKIYCKVL